ncbi:MAG: hypothetical protein IPM24_06355 [Bryobacterales bacterium]|nr:hypothetical protein [Bryobacterales bacterium]
MKHLALLTACAALLACAPPAKQEVAGTKQLSTDELQELLAKGDDSIVFLDVRDRKEIETLGTVEGHVHIPLAELEGRLNELHREKLIVTI